MMDGTTEVPQDATRRLQPKKQTLDDAYAAPANFLEIDVLNPITHGMTRKRYTDYEVRLRVSLALKYITFIAFVHCTKLQYMKNYWTMIRVDSVPYPDIFSLLLFVIINLIVF